MDMELEKLKFDDRGLLPVIVQDSSSGQILMLAYANREALEMTVKTGRTHFWSRSRKKLWNKGEESGHFQDVKEIFVDCDCDTVLITVEQTGAACHTGRPTCFYRSGDMEEKSSPVFERASLAKVFSVIEDRKRKPREGSYVSGLMKGGIDRILKKIGEEAGEVVIAAKNRDKDELVYELTDCGSTPWCFSAKRVLSPRTYRMSLREGSAGARKSTRGTGSDAGRTVSYSLLPLGGPCAF